MQQAHSQVENDELDQLIERLVAGPPYDDDLPTPPCVRLRSVRGSPVPMVARPGVTGIAVLPAANGIPDSELTSNLGDVDPLQVLRAVCQNIARHVGDDAYCLSQRETWLNAHVNLNLEGKLAPRFRPHVRAEFRPTSSSATAMALDRQVIDLHWLHVKSIRVEIAQGEFADLLLTDDFDWDLADDFARYKAGFEIKAGRWLALGDLEAWQLASLQTKEFRTKYAAFSRGDRSTRGAPHIQSALHTIHAIAQDRDIRVETDLAHWMVSKMLGHTTATSQSCLFSLARRTDVPQSAHVYARQQKAALGRLSRHFSP